MAKSTWKITTLKGGVAVASVEGVRHENAIAAIRNAMYSRDPLADVVGGHVTMTAENETLATAAC